MRDMASALRRWVKRAVRWCARPLARRVLAAIERRQAARMLDMNLKMLDFHARLTRQVADEITALSRQLESRSNRAA
jgi:hypothetical protein